MVALPDWCPTYSPRKKDADTGEEVFCICKKPDSGELMVGCDGCDDWFHFSCLKVPKEYNELVFSFYCPYCQAGIMGPGAHDGKLPKTLWRRKCRVLECFKSIADNSKYCSEEHALAFMEKLVQRVEIPGQDPNLVLRQMLQEPDFDHFKNLGQHGLPTPSEDLASKLFSSDSTLQDLEAQLRELRGGIKGDVETQIDQLTQYSQWVRTANDLLFGNGTQENANDDSTAGSKTSRTRKRKQTIKRKAICGYSSELVAPCSAEEFVEDFRQMDSEPTEFKGVCCKLRCIRHSDWASTRESSLQFQLESLQSSEQRLPLLIKIRQDQLKMQFYKQITKV
ncbi:LAFA_0B06282g1_1 [Lachancea sp. 'fantastica']|nr:LAFA_0B06282g1_1 [Lachancea sp. 'fantastica']